MNIEFEYKLRKAEDAADKFCSDVVKKGDFSLLSKDEKVQKLYLDAMNECAPGSEEDKELLRRFANFYTYKVCLIISRGALENGINGIPGSLNGRKSITEAELQPLYNSANQTLDEALEDEDDPEMIDYIKRLKQDNIEEINKTIRQRGISVVSSNTGSQGCYIATAVYGSYDCPQVWTLRRYRDHTLAKSWYGRTFIKCYYAISPTLVKMFGETKWFKNIWRKKLDKMVYNLSKRGVASTPYHDKKW